MTQTLETKLKALLHADCFSPTPEDSSITLTQSHKLAVDGVTRKSWTQKLTITDLEGDEIFFSFDIDGRTGYSHFILGKDDKFYAKSCDYIMLKKTAGRWFAYIGELKMNRVCKDEVDMQTKGTQAFLEYIQNLLKHDGDQELNNLAFVRKVISSRKIKRASDHNRIRPGGLARKRVTSGINLDPVTDILSNDAPYNEITATKLVFNDSDRAHQTITLAQFLAHA
ncbi:hypothetical protein HJ196_14960 [Vibrio parahaemolyticus]|nr:hypothetical protein [Vibrio parahaemolyticus]TBT40866.1 hypothetical protein D5E81_13175 [Vibrio parahaemolyticus]